jgi:pyochelin biosynthetic protein PchC
VTRIAPASSPWLWDLRPDEPGDGATVVILPHAGGSASAFVTWAPGIPPGTRVLAAQYPGRGPRMDEPDAERIDQLVGPLATELSALPGRLVVVGHSIGAVIGLEVARALRSTPRPVDALVVSSSRAPDAPTLFGADTDVPRGAELAGVLRRGGGLPAAVTDHDELLELVLTSVHADLCLLERYVVMPRTEVRLSCPVVVVSGRRDPLVPTDHLDGWPRCTRGRTEVHLLSGGHFHTGDDLERVTALVGELACPTATRRTATRRTATRRTATREEPPR